MAKSKVFWATRDHNGGQWEGKIYVWSYRSHPKLNNRGDFLARMSPVFHVRATEFFGITLKPGEKKKFRLVEG